MAQELGREPVLARWLLRLAMLAVGLLVWWAHVTEIEQLTRAPAQVIAKARTQVVQAPEGGVIEKIFVREGDRVTKGQRVALLQRQRVQAAVNDTQAKVAALRITLTRLTAEALDRPLRFPADLQGVRRIHSEPDGAARAASARHPAGSVIPQRQPAACPGRGGSERAAVQVGRCEQV
jgi:multidrug efflux pump subunit AcrA (membrane-fusion protein)